MRRYFVLTTPLIALVAIGYQGFVYAEEAADPSTEAVTSADFALVNPAAAEKDAPLFRHSTYPAAWTASQQSNRPILVYVSMHNCPHCVKMVERTYELPEVERLVSSSFETIRADRYTHAELVQKLHVKWYPTTILVGPNNKVLDVIEGYVESKAFQRRLQTGLAASTTQTQTR